MGRKDMGVTFRPADSSGSTNDYGNGLDALSRPDALGALVDEVVESEFRIGLAMSRRTQAIERARKYSEALAIDPASGIPPIKSSLEMSRRAFVCEIAA